MTRVTLDALLLGAVLAVTLAWPLHAPPIAHHGEAREGLVVQDIVRGGDWILPRRNGELPSKPPLFHWIAAVAVLGGPSDAMLRLPSALAAWGMAVATLIVGMAAGGRRTGWLAVGALCGMVPFLESATEARVDMVFAACITLALTAFWSWYRDRGPGARALIYAGAAGAVLAKGPAGAVLPALVIVAFLARERQLGVLRALWSWPLVGAVLVVDVGWYLLAYRRGGEEFLALQIGRENVARLVGGSEFARRGHGASSRLVIALLTQLLPWSLVLPWSTWRWSRGVREDAAGRFLHAWWLTVLLVFTVAAGKRTVYLLPAYPAVAVLAARVIDAALAHRGHAAGAWRRPRTVALAITLLDVVLLGAFQGTRVVRAGRDSLVPFAARVRATVAPDVLLEADPAIHRSDLQVLAYRLDRPVPRRQGPARAMAYYLVPLEDAAAPADVVAVSARARTNLALVRAGAADVPSTSASGTGR